MKMAFFYNNEKIFSLHLPLCYLWLLPLILLLPSCETIWFPHNPFWVPEVVIRCPLNLLFSRPDKRLLQCLCVYLMFQFPYGISGPCLHCLQLVGTVEPEPEHSFSEAASQVPSRGEQPLPSPLHTALSLRQPWTWLSPAAGRVLSWARYVPACPLVLSQSLWWSLKL